MALSSIKTWAEGEVLTAASLNAEFSNIYNDDGASFGNPITHDLDMNAQTIILDGNGDTTISAPLDDIYQVTIEGTQAWRVDGSVADPVNSIHLIVEATGIPPRFTTIGDTNVDLNIVPKGTGVVAYEGVLIFSHSEAVLANEVFGS